MGNSIPNVTPARIAHPLSKGVSALVAAAAAPTSRTNFHALLARHPCNDMELFTHVFVRNELIPLFTTLRASKTALRGSPAGAGALRMLPSTDAHGFIGFHCFYWDQLLDLLVMVEDHQSPSSWVTTPPWPREPNKGQGVSFPLCIQPPGQTVGGRLN